MDYRNYKTLMEHYRELNTVNIDQEETEKSLIKKLMDISYEKKQVYNEANAIVKEYIAKYEKAPDLLDEESVVMLTDFLDLLILDGDFLDPSISLRISKLLLKYYQDGQDLEQTIRMLCLCGIFDSMLTDHMDNQESPPYSLMAQQYLDHFDKLSNHRKRALIRCFITCACNRKDPTFALRKYREVRETFEEIYQKAIDELWMKHDYYTFKYFALSNAVLACQKMEDAQKSGIILEKPPIDLAKEAPLMEEFLGELEDVLASEDVHSLFFDAVSIKLVTLETEYYLGKLTVEELLAKIEECSQLHEEYNGNERFTALITTRVTYLTYLCRYSSFDRQHVLDKIKEIIEHVLGNADDAVRELKEHSQFFSTYEINRCALDIVSAVSDFVEFDFFKNTVLNATVYADKALYVHTMMVKEISLTILGYILDHDLQYLEGVAGHGWEYWRDHKEEALNLMENCALFHDIGKYFCLDIVSNSSRNLTDDEFEIIKDHPYNFSRIYKGNMSPEIQCIRDCALLHHRWYNEEGGYPREKHTVNKSLVNILTIADCIDAATDNIGRPYGLGKTLEQLIQEFDEGRDIRYSSYICDLLHVEEIQHGINHIIYNRRREIYCDIYLHTQ